MTPADTTWNVSTTFPDGYTHVETHNHPALECALSADGLGWDALPAREDDVELDVPLANVIFALLFDERHVA